MRGKVASIDRCVVGLFGDNDRELLANM